jgi:hypothetical protein
LPETFHGKEGVDGSSPSEGFKKVLQITILCCPSEEHGHIPDTFAVRATQRDVARDFLTRCCMTDAGTPADETPAQMPLPLPD